MVALFFINTTRDGLYYVICIELRVVLYGTYRHFFNNTLIALSSLLTFTFSLLG